MVLMTSLHTSHSFWRNKSNYEMSTVVTQEFATTGNGKHDSHGVGLKTKSHKHNTKISSFMQQTTILVSLNSNNKQCERSPMVRNYCERIVFWFVADAKKIFILLNGLITCW